MSVVRNPSQSLSLSTLHSHCLISSQKHKLSFQYFRIRHRLLLLCTLLSSLAIGILGFLVTSDAAIKDHMKLKISGSEGVKVRDLLSLLAASLGIAVAMLVVVQQYWDLGGRSRMHWVAMGEMDRLAALVDCHRQAGGNNRRNSAERELGEEMLWQQQRKAVGVVETGNSPTSLGAKKLAVVIASGETLRKVEGDMEMGIKEVERVGEAYEEIARLSTFHGAYHQIHSSCKSTIPNGIHRPFHLFESRLECQSLGHLGDFSHTQFQKNHIMSLASMEIYYQISGYWLWPLCTPNINSVIDRAMRRVTHLVDRNYRSPVTVDCCGWTLLTCCCCREKRRRNDAVYDMFHGMEEREKELAEARQEADYIDTGRRRDDLPLMEEDEIDEEEEEDTIEQRLRPSDHGKHLAIQNGDDDGDFSKSNYSSWGIGSYSRDGSRSRGEYSRDDPSYSRGLSYFRGDRSYSTQSQSFTENISRQSRRYSKGQYLRRDYSVSAAGDTSYDKDMVASRTSFSNRSTLSDYKSRSTRQPKSKGGSRYSRSRGSQSYDNVTSNKSGRTPVRWDEASESQY